MTDLTETSLAVRLFAELHAVPVANAVRILNRYGLTRIDFERLAAFVETLIAERDTLTTPRRDAERN
jgi:hypothetical protein